MLKNCDSLSDNRERERDMEDYHALVKIHKISTLESQNDNSPRKKKKSTMHLLDDKPRSSIRKAGKHESTAELPTVVKL